MTPLSPFDSSSSPSSAGDHTNKTSELIKLNESLLHGAWSFTAAVYDQILHVPNARIVNTDSPRVVLLEQFLTRDEIDHLLHFLSLDDSALQLSQVVGTNANRTLITTQGRTSYGMWYVTSSDPISFSSTILPSL